jgi:hypothetical protein
MKRSHDGLRRLASKTRTWRQRSSSFSLRRSARPMSSGWRGRNIRAQRFGCVSGRLARCSISQCTRFYVIISTGFPDQPRLSPSFRFEAVRSNISALTSASGASLSGQELTPRHEICVERRCSEWLKLAPRSRKSPVYQVIRLRPPSGSLRPTCRAIVISPKSRLHVSLSTNGGQKSNASPTFRV